MDPQLTRSLRTLVRMAILVLVLLIIYLLFTYVLPLAGRILVAIPGYIMPFIIAILFAILIEPLVNRIEKRLKLNRGWSVFLSLILVWGTVGLLLTSLITRLIDELVGLYKAVAEQSTQISNMIAGALGRAELFYLRLNLPDNVQQSIQNSLFQYLDNLEQALNGTANWLMGFLAALPGFFVFFLIATVATFFIMRDRAIIRQGFLDLLPERWKGTTQEVIGDLFEAFIGFLKAYSLLVLITGLQTVAGLKLLGVEYALTLGIITGLLDILPILGPGTLFIPWAIFAYVSGNTGFGTGLLVLYAVLVGVRQFLEPKLVGDSIGLHPLATLVSLYVGLKLIGPPGLILGPVVVILYLACRRAGAFEQLSFYFRKV